MTDFDVGMRFNSYKDLMVALNEFGVKTQTKYWKRDARKIAYLDNVGFSRFINPDLEYFELRFSCIYGGSTFKSRSGNLRKRYPLKKTHCPVYLRFKAAEDGSTLQLIAMNMKHNHELVLPKKPVKGGMKKFAGKRGAKKLKLLQQMDNVEIEQNSAQSDDEDGVEDYIELTISEETKIEHKPFTYKGLIVPVFTPFNDNPCRTLNRCVIPSYAEFLHKASIKGVLINGTSGEGPSMSVEERKLVTESWVPECKRYNLHCMVQIGGAPLPDVLELAMHAEHEGVDSLLCLPELYHKPKRVKDLISYLELVAKAAPNTPLLYYHIPSLTDVNIHMGQFLNEVVGKIPTFTGIKFTSTVLDEGLEALKAGDGQFSVFLGADSIMAGAYALGFDSAIATSLNMMANYGINILSSCSEGDFAKARDVQEKLTAAIALITKHGTWVPTMKAAMEVFTSIKCGPPRYPLVRLTEEQIREMERDLQNLPAIANN